MRERRLWGAAVFAVFTIAMRAAPSAAAEPMYQGKPAAKWLELLTSHDDAERQSAAKAIAADPKSAKPVLNEFVRQLDEPNVARRARLSAALALTGPAAVPSLLDGLLNPDATVRRNSFSALRASGVPATELAAPLIRLLPKLDDEIQEKVLIAIGDLGPKAIPVLIEATRYRGREELRVRKAAIRLLLEHVSDSKLVVQAIIERLGDASPEVRGDAAEALGFAAPSDRVVVVDALRKVALRDANSKVRYEAVRSLKRLALPHATAKLLELQVLRILGNLQDHDTEIIRQAILEVGKLGSAASEAKPALTAMLSDPDFATRSLAAAALALVSHRDDSLGVIAEGVKKGEVLHPGVIEMLIAYGPAAVPVLLNASHHEMDDRLRKDLGYAVAKVPIRADDAKTLRGLLTHETPYVRAWALEKLIDIRDQSPATIAALAKRMADPDRKSRENAALTMMELGQAAVPALMGVARDKNPLVRRKAVFVITTIGKPSSAAIDALVRALDDQDEQVRFWACVALGRVKNQQSRLAPLMIARQTDASVKVRKVARNAFQQLILAETTD